MMNVLMMVVALAAPALGSATTPTCDKWLSKFAIEGDHIKTVDKPDPRWCKKECMRTKGCEAVTFVRDYKNRKESKCSLFKIDGDSMLHKDSRARSFVFCGKCDKLENNVDFEGEELMSFQIKDVWWCRKKCMKSNDCNAFTWQRSGRLCTLKKVLPEFKRSKKRGVRSYLHCKDYGVLPICDRGDIVANGVCDAPGPQCGLRNQPICQDGPDCKAGLSINSDAKCVCGGKWQHCCEGSCDAGLECDMNGSEYGHCSPCGGDATNDYQMCCGGDTCNQHDKRRVCLPGKGQRGCAPCGGLFQPICGEEPKCDGMNMPDPHGKGHNIQCVMNGAD